MLRLVEHSFIIYFTEAGTGVKFLKGHTREVTLTVPVIGPSILFPESSFTFLFNFYFSIAGISIFIFLFSTDTSKLRLHIYHPKMCNPVKCLSQVHR